MRSQQYLCPTPISIVKDDLKNGRGSIRGAQGRDRYTHSSLCRIDYSKSGCGQFYSIPMRPKVEAPNVVITYIS